MNRKQVIFKVILLGLSTLFISQGVLAEDRPNFVVILCDDLGYGDLECYGHPHIQTPHLNQLAAEGIRFTNFYSAAPVCSPSRVGLLTGRSPNKAGVFDWIPESTRSQAQNRHLVHMRAEEVTIPQLLKQAGYATCMAGKWHCNSEFNSVKQPQPNDFGFDHWLGTQNNASPSHENPENFVRNGKPIGKQEGYSCQIAVDEAIHWLKNQKSSDQPFFLYLPFHEPHEPVASPPELVKKYDSVARNADEAQYFANVTNVDLAVGRFIEALETLEIRDNTLVIFTSDNGPETLDRYPKANRSYGQPGPLRGMKLHTHDAGFRVAGVMNWPGKIKPGQVSATPVSSLDFLPTFCQLAKTDLPEDIAFDGTIFLPALKGKPVNREKPLVWAYYAGINKARVAMRDGKWKVLAQLEGLQDKLFRNLTPEILPQIKQAKLTNFEIYDLSKDIHEENNLAETDPQLLEQYSQKLNEEYQALLEDSYIWKAE
ncbi:N-acetylgalactosamine-6-sulfatase [Planctomycetales bacterium 10988]|nr:N-acetylgalactosamine-6-sulfatase [Planctomycetales bacterium 10988]